MNKPIATMHLCNCCSLVIDEIDDSNDRVHVYTSGVENKKPQWCDIDYYTTEEPSIVYRGGRYELSQFIRVNLF